MKRIANATAETEMEVTPEMIAAGVAVFRALDVFDFFATSTLEAIAAEVYAAMASAPEGKH